MIRISNVARAFGRTITTTSSKLVLVATLAIVTITSSALAQSSTRDGGTGNVLQLYAFAGTQRAEVARQPHQTVTPRSHPCDYRDFHVWDQTYHCNE
jgi:hypothetical protein